MAKRGAQTCVLLLVILFLIRFETANGEEHEHLLSFKASVSDPLRFLSNWNNSSSTGFCNWYGITCTNSSHVTGIELSGKNISGELSSALFRLPFIENINLSNNEFSGELSEEIFSCLSLRYLNLSNNNFTGTIPRGFIPGLETLDLSNNMLSGEIPAGIGLFSSLKVIDLGGNVFHGRIPNTISRLKSLQFLTLSSNQLVGEIPPELGQIKSLKLIYLGYNNLSGEIPMEIGELTSLKHLDLVYNNLSGEIPSSLGNLTDLRYLFLYQNRLTGSLPRSIFNLRNLISLDLSDNSLSGEISELVIQLQNLEILHLFSNNFTGKIPKAMASLPRLQLLQLWSNSLSGEIPKNLGKQNNLTVLDLSTNNLTGEIPVNLCASGRLFKLILFSNFLRGDIPKSLSNCRSLQRIRLQNNGFSGELSPGFTKLPLVYYLDISGNNLSGRIDRRKWDMPSLQMLNLARNNFFGNLPVAFGSEKLENLDLSENRLSGNILPGIFGSLSELVELKISGNQLSGFIPEELSFCKKLVNLDLSQNQLTGQIPTWLSEMPVLGDLDLSQNQLSGEIPPNLGKVESLVQVNISHNHLHGGLPATGAFLAINASAVTGNDLCGGDNIRGLQPCKTTKKPAWWFFITSLLVVLVVLALSVLVLVFICRRNEAQLKKVDNEDGIWELQWFSSKVLNSVMIDDILSLKNEENIISKGRNGTLYKGKSAVSELQFVVKEMNDYHSISSSFWKEMIQLGILRHPNVVKLIGICRSKKCGFLVYEFIEGKSLIDVLGGGLSWERRRRIAIQIARTLRFLHCRCSPAILVRNMSPEKVIIDGKDEPRLRLSHPSFITNDSKGFHSSGYVAPETVVGNEITEKSDIYGFGVLLIQILTGKSPADTELGVHGSIVEWARYCYSECHFDTWIDPAIKGYALNHQNEIVEMMNLALQCTAADPKARPYTMDAVKTLECVLRVGSCGSSLKFWDSI